MRGALDQADAARVQVWHKGLLIPLRILNEVRERNWALEGRSAMALEGG
ncbi:MAG TPA: hypothetical protein VGG96_10995 [Steroidobacteraceae bacterium]